MHPLDAAIIFLLDLQDPEVYGLAVTAEVRKDANALAKKLQAYRNLLQGTNVKPSE